MITLMRILIYGFGPYRRFRDNVSETILRQLPKRRGLKKVVFPVRFHKRQFVQAVQRYNPDVVLGLGQCSAGGRLRAESTAVNRRQDVKTDKPRSIVAGGKRKLPTTLKLNLGPTARPSRDAGTYVCNYSMYVILDLIRRNRLPIRLGFVHIPYDYDSFKASRTFEKAIAELRALK